MHEQAFPFIHRPSFDVNQTSLLVTIALTSIGACYSEREGAHEFATAMAELNRRLLLFMACRSKSKTVWMLTPILRASTILTV